MCMYSKNDDKTGPAGICHFCRSNQLSCGVNDGLNFSCMVILAAKRSPSTLTVFSWT